jgi:hypothetical protein
MQNPKLEVLTPSNSQLIFIDQQPQMAFGVQNTGNPGSWWNSLLMVHGWSTRATTGGSPRQTSALKLLRAAFSGRMWSL